MIQYEGQIELVSNNLLMGAYTPITIRRDPEPQGLIGLEVTTADQEIIGRDGSVGGPESYRPRMITIPIRVYNADPVRAREAFQEVLDKWQLIRTGTTTLDVRFPGQPEEVLHYYGRPRDISESNIFRAVGLYEVDLQFDALDPYGYGEEISVAESGSTPLVFTNPGNASTYRANVHINGDGGHPVLVNNSTSYSGNIVSAFSIPVGQYIDLDMYEMSAVRNGVTNYDHGITVISKWFEIVPGENSIAFTDCDSISLTYTPAYF